MAGLAAAAAQQCRLPAADVALARRAGWVHDLGRITVSAAVWEETRRPDPRGRERVRLHAYHTERVFDGVPAQSVAAVSCVDDGFPAPELVLDYDTSRI